ncbi:MAG: hypothetical protein OEZ65_16790 [Gemmatimonadota bacterium]|nr:hypothetical protein [Gemmatimonadota bacterium]MDH5761223.1 hypothetical protein [Gemmatimonadota bacterium]
MPLKHGGKGDLHLGSRVVEFLIPQRRPFLMVDAVDAFHPEDPPRIETHRCISANEAVFEGHFPGMPLWPGALTLEGLAQSAGILMVLTRLCRRTEERGYPAEQSLEALRNLDRGFRMHPGYRPDGVAELLALLEEDAGEMGVGAHVDLKFLAPVLPGSRLDYAVHLTDTVGNRVRFSVEAFVDDVPVASGSITGAVVPRPVLPRPTPPGPA